MLNLQLTLLSLCGYRSVQKVCALPRHSDYTVLSPRTLCFQLEQVTLAEAFALCLCISQPEVCAYFVKIKIVFVLAVSRCAVIVCHPHWDYLSSQQWIRFCTGWVYNTLLDFDRSHPQLNHPTLHSNATFQFLTKPFLDPLRMSRTFIWDSCSLMLKLIKISLFGFAGRQCAVVLTAILGLESCYSPPPAVSCTMRAGA